MYLNFSSYFLNSPLISLTHTTCKFQKKESWAFAKTVSTVTLQKTRWNVNIQSVPLKNCRPGTKESIHARRELPQHPQTMCVTFNCSRFSPWTWNNTLAVCSLEWQPYSRTVKTQRETEERQWQIRDIPLFTDFSVVWDVLWGCQALCWPVCVCAGRQMYGVHVCCLLTCVHSLCSHRENGVSDELVRTVSTVSMDSTGGGITHTLEHAERNQKMFERWHLSLTFVKLLTHKGFCYCRSNNMPSGLCTFIYLIEIWPSWKSV